MSLHSTQHTLDSNDAPNDRTEQKTRQSFSLFPEDVPLPPTSFDGTDSTLWHRAYEYCRQMEAEAGEDAKLLMYSRVLGYMILEAPSSSGRTFIALEITECIVKEVDVNILAEFYVNYLFGILSRPTNEFVNNEIEHHIDNKYVSVVPEAEPIDEITARRSVLHRDGFSCMISGELDYECFVKMTIDQRLAFFGGRSSCITHTKLCNVIPPSVNWDLNLGQYGYPTTKDFKSLGSIVKGFGGIDVATELSGDKAYRTSNGLTLSIIAREFFNIFYLWFEEIPEVPNTYTVRTLRHCSVVKDTPKPQVFTFNTTTGIPLPDPRYLRFHASVCRIAHLANVYPYLLNMSWERNSMAEDGTSADILAAHLSHALTSSIQKTPLEHLDGAD